MNAETPAGRGRPPDAGGDVYTGGDGTGPRKIGHGTAFITFPDYLGQRVDAYSTTAVSLTYRDLLPKLTLQLLADNVFDKQYSVVGSESLPMVLQNGRTVSVRMIYRLK